MLDVNLQHVYAPKVAGAGYAERSAGQMQLTMIYQQVAQGVRCCAACMMCGNPCPKVNKGVEK